MKIYIVDNDKEFIKKVEKELKTLGYFNVKTFDFSNKDYILKHPPEVFIFKDIENSKKLIKKLKKIKEDILIIAIIPKEESDFCKYFKIGISAYLKSDYSFEEFKVKMKLINNFLKSIKKEKKENEKLKKQLLYKNAQEELAIIKQKKLLRNELFMFYENEHLLENYISSKDVLSGDALFSKRIKENEYVLCIADAMGKGLNASLTSITTTAFLEYSIEKSLEMKDFDFTRMVKDFLNYSKAILLDTELFSAILVYIKNDKLFYANFGMPPIYTPTKKFKSNNLPINKNLKNFKIDEIDLPEKFFILSDGLIESRLKEKKGIYYERFLDNLNLPFLKNLLDDFKNNAIQDDDISIIHYRKDKITKKIFNINGIIKDKKNLDDVLKKIPKNIKNYEKIIYVMQELLMNTLEHSIYDLQMKKEYIDLDDVVGKNDCKNECIRVGINFYHQDNFIKIEYKENSKGFDINILKDLDNAKYHGKGIKIIKFLSDGVFFNHKANAVKIFLKDEE